MPLEQRRDEEEEEEAGLADAAFISDPAAAKAAREQLEQHMLEAEEDEMVPGIETDDDVVQFYARYGQDSEVSSRHKFFYCVPVESGLEYLPYDLRVVRMDKGRLEKGEMYYTMSATGVMKIFKGVQSEFMSLAEWVREKTHFRMWRRTPFFRNNVVAQMFQQWTMTVRRRKFERKRAQLQRTLFLAQPTFCSPICELLKVIDEIRSLDLARLTPPTGKEARDNPLDTTPGKNSGHIHPGTELKQYVRKQTEIRELELEAINNRMQRVQSILEAVCREAQKQAKLYRESIRDLKELKDTTGVDLYQRAGEKHRSMVAIREEKVQRAETYHRVMHEAERLPFFVRLADYMTCEALIEQAVWTAEWMVHVLHNTRAPPERPYLVPGFDDATPATTLGKKMFITYARYADEGGMAFEPDQGDFEGALLGVVDGVLATVSSVVPVIKMRAFGQYFSSRLEGLTVGQVIRQSPRFVAARDAITEIVAADFVAAGEHVSQYEQYAAIKAFYDTWDHTQYNLAEATRESMFSDLMENKGHFNSVKNKIKSMHQTGVLQVDARRDIKEVLLPKVTQAYEDLKMKMHEKFKQMVAEQRRNFQLRVDFLEKRPDEKDLELFFAYKRAIDTDFRAKANDFKNEFAEVERLFETLTSDPINMALPDVDRGDYHDLSNLVDRFGEALEAGDEFCRNRTSDFTAHVEIQVRHPAGRLKQRLQPRRFAFSSLPYSPTSSIPPLLPLLSRRLAPPSLCEPRPSDRRRYVRSRTPWSSCRFR